MHAYKNNEVCFHAHTSVSVITFIKEISDFKRSPSNLRKHIEVVKLLSLSPVRPYISYTSY